MTEKQDLQQRRAALLIALDNTPGGAERVEIQARISEIKARLTAINTAEAAAAKAAADERKAAGRAEHDANTQRALGQAARHAGKAKPTPPSRATDGHPPDFGEMLLHRAKQARALIAARAKAAASWPHVAAFVPHLDAFIAAQEQHLADRMPAPEPAAQDAGEQQAPEAWQETWSS